jgi:hypothetical protein
MKHALLLFLSLIKKKRLQIQQKRISEIYLIENDANLDGNLSEINNTPTRKRISDEKKNIFLMIV